MYSGVVSSQIVIHYNLNVTYIGKVMEIPLIVRDHQYTAETVAAWQNVWKLICDMSYHGTNIQEEIITSPGQFQIDEEIIKDNDESEQCYFYNLRYALNVEELTLDHIWKQYSQKAGPGVVLHVVPEFKHLHVPLQLHYTLGVNSWFAESFPNCKVTYWKR